MLVLKAVNELCAEDGDAATTVPYLCFAVLGGGAFINS
jgi:hypothetical protein